MRQINIFVDQFQNEVNHLLLCMSPFEDKYTTAFYVLIEYIQLVIEIFQYYKSFKNIGSGQQTYINDISYKLMQQIYHFHDDLVLQSQSLNKIFQKNISEYVREIKAYIKGNTSDLKLSVNA